MCFGTDKKVMKIDQKTLLGDIDRPFDIGHSIKSNNWFSTARVVENQAKNKVTSTKNSCHP